MVTTLAPQLDDGSTIRMVLPRDGTDPRLSALLAYWDGRRGGRPMPARADLDPADIPRLLPNVFLVDVGREADDLRWRLAGTEVVRMFGAEVTGRTVGEGMDPVASRLLRARLAFVVRSARPVYVTGTMGLASDRHVPFQRLVLPLSADGRRVDMLFGMLVGMGFDTLLTTTARR